MKKQRVKWGELQPGDLVHVKGSGNTYTCIGTNGSVASVATPGVGVAFRVPDGAKPLVQFTLTVDWEHFAFATRLRAPGVGEYWVDYGTGWRRMVACGNQLFGTCPTCYTIDLRHYDTWQSFLLNVKPQRILSSEEYWTRKVKGMPE